MCHICLQPTCDTRCPNAEPETPAYICEICGDKIHRKDRHYDIDGEIFCRDCLSEWAKKFEKIAGENDE